MATVCGHISTVDVACNYGSLEQTGCASTGSEMLGEYNSMT